MQKQLNKRETEMALHREKVLEQLVVGVQNGQVQKEEANRQSQKVQKNRDDEEEQAEKQESENHQEEPQNQQEENQYTEEQAIHLEGETMHEEKQFYPQPSNNKEQSEIPLEAVTSPAKSITEMLVQHKIPNKANDKTKKQSKTAQTLQNNKCIKTIFSHFCKENYLSSMKSTLFQEKKKTMQEMPLNKWMVFCKQFDIFTKLCSLKIQQRKKVEESQGTNMENSRIKEQLKVKELKEVEKILGQIFKKATENHIKMQFHHFLQAAKLICEQFKGINKEIIEISYLQFAKSYLYCQSQQQCMQKLSNLKFTFGIPQIDYSKVQTSPIQRDKSISRLKTDMKQNLGQKQGLIKKIKVNESKTMNLNPIIKQAKNVLYEAQNKTLKSTHCKPGSKIKLTLQQSKYWKEKKGGKINETSELLTYLDSTKDEILQSYFKGQKLLNVIQKAK